MKFFQTLSVILAFSAATLVDARPQYGSSSSSSQQKQKCRIVNDVEYVESVEQVCENKIQRVCNTAYKQECTPYQDEVCKTVNKRQCDTKRRQKCSQKYRQVPEPYTEEVCNDIWDNECVSHWETDGYGSKVWVEDKNNCKRVKRTKCDTVQKQRMRSEPYEACDWENYQDCYNVPDKQCEYVTKQNCKRVPYQDCQNQPKRECHNEHKKTPKQISRKVCGNANAGGVTTGSQPLTNDYDYDYDYDDVHSGSNAGGGYNAQSVSNAFNQQRKTQGTSGSSSGNKKVGVSIRSGSSGAEKPAEKDDRIHFG